MMINVNSYTVELVGKLIREGTQQSPENFPKEIIGTSRFPNMINCAAVRFRVLEDGN